MHDEVKSHFSTLKTSGGCRAKGENRELEHGDVVYVVGRYKVNKLSFPQDKDGIIERQHTAVVDEDLFIITPEEAAKVMAKYKEEETGQLSITAEMERNGEFDVKED